MRLQRDSGKGFDHQSTIFAVIMNGSVCPAWLSVAPEGFGRCHPVATAVLRSEPAVVAKPPAGRHIADVRCGRIGHPQFPMCLLEPDSAEVLHR